MFSASGFETRQVLGELPEHRQLLFDRNVFGDDLLKTRHQPANGSGTCAGFERVNVGPVVFRQVVQQAKAGQQAGEGFTLVKRPGQPGADTQILGLGTQEIFAVFANFQPVDLPAFVHRRGFGQLAFQRLEFARKTNVFAREILFGNRDFGEFEVMGGKFA